MGWTHDYDTTARNRRSASGRGKRERGGPQDQGRVRAAQGAGISAQGAGLPAREGTGTPTRQGAGTPAREVGISRILRRRARWVSARLRHPRD